MPSFLTNNNNQCCCSEMRCCTPETVTVTLSGWGGTNVNNWVSRVWNAPYPFPDGYADLGFGALPCAYESGTTGCFTYLSIGWDDVDERFEATGIYLGCYDLVWPSIAFPQKIPRTYQPGYFTCPPGQEGQVYVDEFTSDEQFAQKCEDYGRLCESPGAGTGSIVYGPSAATTKRTYLADYNDSYVCHRLRGDMRPEFSATVNRSSQGTDEDIDARLVFDVFCRRNWVFDADCNVMVIPNLTCAVSDTPPENAPAGTWYCIDYRCGPRYPAADGIHSDACTQYKCTAHEGMVWPHLMAIPPNENYTALLHLILEPDVLYGNTEFSYQAAKPQKPMSWRVGSVKIVDAGSGYEVGESFKVDFDPFWMNSLSGGELLFVFPDYEANCSYFPLTWRDKYGAAPEIGQYGEKRYYQTLRVMKVDDDGGVAELEIVPWFSDPEFVPYACPEVVPSDQRTPRYPSYARNICHPNSVDIGGTGYNINDTITFHPESPGVETYSAAIAKVVDVDDDGAVLDWEIKGTDVWQYGFGLGRQYCYLAAPDERGAYKWPDKTELCYLHWEGVGVPVREITSYSVAPMYADGSWANTGAATHISITILRKPCRTSISVNVGPYKYEQPGFEVYAASDEADQTTRLLKKYPPYPRCFGGGAQITPIIGTDGGNESAIGGPLAGGNVKSGGDYYAFRDKSHVAPTLPTTVPAIGDGRGAIIGFFSFGEVLGFPRVDYADGESHEPAADRFAYYPVTGATISDGGSGYEVGQEFDVQPEGGTQWTHAWKISGGDDPDSVPNGSWYASQPLNSTGHVPLYTVVNGTTHPEEPGVQKEGICRLRISDVDEDGAITSLDVVHGGLMFRPVWGGGVRHPDVWVSVNSDTGTGAKATVAIDANAESESFGEVTSCAIVPMPLSEMNDPLHDNGAGGPAAMPLGGRDYANPRSGMMWEMENIVAGAEFGVAPATMLSYINWHGWTYYDTYHQNSTHDVVESSGHPLPFHRRAEHCTLDECYHSLLNRSYPLFRLWSGAAINPASTSIPGDDNTGTDDVVDAYWAIACGTAKIPPNSYSPLPNSDLFLAGKPKSKYAVFRPKNLITSVYSVPEGGLECDELGYTTNLERIDQQPGYDGNPTAGPLSYTVMEWGYTAALSAVIPVYPNCPSHTSGRTSP